MTTYVTFLYIILLIFILLPLFHYVILRKMVKDLGYRNIRLILCALLVSYSPLISYCIFFAVEHSLDVLILKVVPPIVVAFALECLILWRFRIVRVLVYIINTVFLYFLATCMVGLLFGMGCRTRHAEPVYEEEIIEETIDVTPN